MSEKKARRKWRPSEKMRIVLETMQSDEKMSEICRREGVSPTMVHQWRKQLLGSADAVFGRKVSNGQEDRRVGELTAQNQRMKNVIAEITAENLELKKTLLD